LNYLLRRVLTYLGVLIAVSQLDFILPRLAPGDPALFVTPYGINTTGSDARIQAITILLGLNKPVWTQYAIYMKNVFATWPPYFGVSFQYFPTPVSQLFFSRIGWTMLLIAGGLVLSIVVSALLAAYSSIARGGKAEVASVYTSILFQSTPIYWSAVILLLVFGATLHWVPNFGNVNPTIHAGFNIAYIQSVLAHAILPIVILAASMFGEMYLIMRGTAQDVLKSDYVIAAKTRGLRKNTIAFAYILRNSILPLVSVLSFSLAGIIGRVVLIEAIFGYNGVGDMLVDGAVNHDYPVLEGSLFLLMLFIIAGGLIGDIILVRIDPRLRVGS
jgi:peptide/nickel transport system permease protein